jgi:hypothetical protein
MFLEFFRATQWLKTVWPSYIPDLKHEDYSILQAKVNTTAKSIKDPLRRIIWQEWDRLCEAMMRVRRTCCLFRLRSEKIIVIDDSNNNWVTRKRPYVSFI